MALSVDSDEHGYDLEQSASISVTSSQMTISSDKCFPSEHVKCVKVPPKTDVNSPDAQNNTWPKYPSLPDQGWIKGAGFRGVGIKLLNIAWRYFRLQDINSSTVLISVMAFVN